MPSIKTIPPSKATGETAEVYRYMAEMGGISRVAKIVQMFSLRPGSMRRMIRTWELTMWMGKEPRTTRELVAVAVSRLNDCHY
jgi:alkylhydroperoxidase family enzyme